MRKGHSHKASQQSSRDVKPTAVPDEMTNMEVDYDIYARHDEGRRVMVEDASYNGPCALKWKSYQRYELKPNTNR
jgi:hypothetical protein